MNSQYFPSTNMRCGQFRAIAGALVLVFVSACSNPDTPLEEAPSGAENRWSFGEFTYAADTNFQFDEVGTTNRIMISVNDRGTVDNGLYTGASMDITLTDTEAGVYSLTNLSNFERDADSGIRLLHITLTVGLGDATTGIASYTSTADVGIATVTVNELGQYFVTIEEPVVLTRNSATSEFDSEPSQLEVTALNVFGEPLTTQ